VLAWSGSTQAYESVDNRRSDRPRRWSRGTAPKTTAESFSARRMKSQLLRGVAVPPACLRYQYWNPVPVAIAVPVLVSSTGGGSSADITIQYRSRFSVAVFGTG